MIVTIEEAANEIANALAPKEARLPKGLSLTATFGKYVEGPPLAATVHGPRPPEWRPAEGSPSTAFRLSIERALSIPHLKTRLLELAADGTLRLRNHLGLCLPPGSEAYESSYVNLDEARAALEADGLEFEEPPVPTGAPCKTAIEPWIVRAREYAANIWLRDLANNKRPTKEGIAPEIAARLWRDDKMVTKRDKRIEAGYIVSHALSPKRNGGWEPPKPE